MNVSPPIEDVDINVTDKSKDSTSDLFEFRASENDVIQENDSKIYINVIAIKIKKLQFCFSAFHRWIQSKYLFG